MDVYGPFEKKRMESQMQKGPTNMVGPFAE
jgi:hypothetical protein